MTKTVWDDANRAWDVGGFSRSWRDVRHLAAMGRGIVYPPAGDTDDGWDDPHPSQRSIVARAMVVNPVELREVLSTPGPSTWASVVKTLLERWNDRERLAVEVERLDAIRRRAAEPSRREASDVLRSIGDILGSGR